MHTVFSKTLSNYRLLVGIIFFGLLLRILSIEFANLYHENKIFYIGGDSGAYIFCFDSLISTGTYTINIDSEYGYFGRMPGYPFYIGIFYFLSGMNWEIALQMVYFSQIILDTVAIYLVYQISAKIFTDNKVALLNSFLYATYPFIIIWNPILFAEASSVFFLLLGIWLLVVSEKKYHLLFVGISLSISALMRPQLICIFPLILIVIYQIYKKKMKLFFFHSLLYLFSVMIVYGAWPARNYILYNKLILTQDIRGLVAWDTDINAFYEYLYSVHTSGQPIFTDITFRKTKVKFPPCAYKVKADSILLDSTIELCRSCGRGFKAWREDFKGTNYLVNNCNEKIVENFRMLKKSQIENNPLNYYLTLPLKNLGKALFKQRLANNDTKVKKMSFILFTYRSCLIFTGIIGLIIFLKRRRDETGIAITSLILFLFIYGILCFGPTDQMRNIEMRYFLHPDILLLFFGGYSIIQLLPQKR